MMTISTDAKHELRLDFLQGMLEFTMGMLIAQAQGDSVDKFAELRNQRPTPDGLDEQQIAALTYIREVRRQFFERVTDVAKKARATQAT